MTNINLKQKLEQIIAAKIAEANKFYGCNIVIRPVVWYKCGLAAGFASMPAGCNPDQRCKLEFSEEAAEKHTDKFINEFIPHEVAHLVCFKNKWDYKHGAKWKAVCIQLGGNGKVFVDAELNLTRSRKIKKYEYKTSAGNIWVGSKHHNRMQRDHVTMIVKRTKECITQAMWTGKVKEA